jgi:hypothetical protein
MQGTASSSTPCKHFPDSKRKPGKLNHLKVRLGLCFTFSAHTFSLKRAWENCCRPDQSDPHEHPLLSR